jgi:23S rRNA pseudouridine1911/1915/1917 synthase
MKEQLLISDENDIRLDVWLSRNLKEYSRTFFQKLIDDNMILVNGNIVKSKYKLSFSDRITVKIPDPVPLEIKGEDIPLDIIFEDMDILVINKPKGMVVHPAPGNPSHTLVNAVLNHCRDDLSDINGVIRPGIVHRLDKDTSGLIIVAKNNNAHKRLTSAFKNREVGKIYFALVKGVIKENNGVIDLSISRHPVERKKFAHIPGKGRQAQTSFKVIERFNDVTYVEVTLHTGRTHQIRVHFSHIGHPVLGDPVYSRKSEEFGLDGQALHAGFLSFKHPVSGHIMNFEAPLPNYFKELLEKIKKI